MNAEQVLKMGLMLPEPLRIFGLNKYMTYHCLLIQLLNAALHVGAFLFRPLRKPRDLVFTTLAYPLSMIVVLMFWGVWHIIGREFIFPESMAPYYPDWLNHATHTIIAPINLLLALSIRHEYMSNASLVTMAYFACYCALLNYIKYITGYSVYGFLDAMAETERYVFFLGSAVFAYLMFKTGQMLTNLWHGNRAHAASAQRRSTGGRAAQKSTKQN